MQEILELLSYLTDPKKEVLLRSRDPEEYFLLEEYAEHLDTASREARKREIALPAELGVLLELLDEIIAETDVKAVYNEGRTEYTDVRGRVIDDPNRRWHEYVANDPKWKRALQLARAMVR